MERKTEKNELPAELSSIEVDEKKLMHVAKMAEMGMSVAAVAHEVRQPLSALKMALQMVREKVIDQYALRGDVDEALQQARRIEMLIERTRSFLAPSRGKIKLNLAEVTESVVALMKWHAGIGKKKGEIELELDRQVPPVTADRSMVEQLVSNLIVNARDAVAGMGNGRIVVVVRKSGDGSGVEVLVADNGTGIDPSAERRIFEPFFSTKGASNGTGLGLYIVKRIAEDHEALVEIVNRERIAELNKGRLSTAFSVVFPYALTRSTIPPPPDKKKGSGEKRALIVDDEIAILKVLGQVLEQEGFEPVLAESGEDALEKLENETFSLLVIDKNLPGASGIEVAHLARNMDMLMPILVITGYASEDSALEALSLGVADYVLKPLDLNDFRARVAKVLGQAALESAIPRPPSITMVEDPEKVDVAVKVLLIEKDTSVQDVISDALLSLGCEVAAFYDDETAATRVKEYPYEVLIARPEVLRRRRSWFKQAPGVLGAIVVMDRMGVDKTIEAIHLGARGVFAPPFDHSSVAFDFRRTVSRLIQENR